MAFCFPKSLRRCRRCVGCCRSPFSFRQRCRLSLVGRQDGSPSDQPADGGVHLCRFPGGLVEGRKSVELLTMAYSALMSCNIRPQQPLNKPVHKTFGDEKKKKCRCGVPLGFSFQQPFSFVEDLLRVYIVIYQYIICHIQQFNKISEVFKHIFGDGIIPAYTVLGQIVSCTVVVVLIGSVSKTVFSTLTCEQTSNGMMSLRQKETELTPTLAMMSSRSSVISISKRLRLLRIIFRRASVSSSFGLNHIRLSFSVDSCRCCRK